jgi:formylglycine-generating enzyme required for sulfatase activity
MARPERRPPPQPDSLEASWTRDDGPEARIAQVVAVSAALAREHQNKPSVGPFGPSSVLVPRGVDASISQHSPESTEAPWLPPECVAGAPWTAQSDVYALAVLCWRTLHGRWPADAASAALTRHRRLGEPIGTLPVDRHTGLTAALRRALDADPARRPSSARVFASIVADAAAADQAGEKRGAGIVRAQLRGSAVRAPLAAAAPTTFALHWRRWGRWLTLALFAGFVGLFVKATADEWGREGWPCRGDRDCRGRGNVCSNSVCVRDGWVYAPPAQFRMGSASGEPGRAASEYFRSVRISRPFIIRRRETTQESWQRVMNNNPAHFAACGDQCPIESVSYYDVLEYLNRLSDMRGLQRCYELEDCEGTPGGGCSELSEDLAGHGCRGDFVCNSVHFVGLDCLGYRLPTEAEWEYAARAESTTTFPNGDWTAESEGSAMLDRIGRVARFSYNADVRFEGGIPCAELDQPSPSEGSCGPSAVQVGMGNRWRLQQMHGNVQEWITDCQSEEPQLTETDPVGACPPGAAGVRGGAFYHGAMMTRSAFRGLVAPADVRFIDLGFRPVRTIESGNVVSRIARSLFGG